jgi:signal transduction histidine kinase
VSLRHVLPYETGILGVYLLLALVYVVVHRAERRGYFQLWAIACVLTAVHDGLRLGFNAGLVPASVGQLARLALLGTAACLLVGLKQFLGLELRRGWLTVGAALVTFTGASVLWAPLRSVAEIAVFWALAAALVFCGVHILGMTFRGSGHHLTGLGLLLFGVWAGAFPFVRHQSWFAPVEAEIGLLLVLTVSIGVLLLHFELARNETRALAERNSALLVEAVQVASRERVIRERLEQAERMESLGRLAGGVAHDFNNILTIILGSVDLAREAVDTNAAARASLDQAREAASRAAALTRQLLTFSRGGALRPRTLDLNEAIAGALELVRPMCGPDVKLDLRRVPQPLSVRGDRSQIDQVLMNLILNARDALPSGGVITIDTSAVRNGGGVEVARLSVHDQGVGIPPEILPRIFEPFFTTKPKPLGTGLGLATVYSIVRDLGGEVLVESDRARGTTFVVELPSISLVEDGGDARPPEAPGPQVAGGAQVLLVEDDELVARVLASAIEGVGHRVTVHRSAEEALAGGGLASCDLLLTDLSLPGASGVELARAAVASRGDLRVVFMSGHTDEKIALEEWPHARFLAKPFRMEELLEAVARAVGAAA